MPISFRFYNSQQLILAKGTDPLSDSDCIDHAHQILSHPDFAPGFVELLDLRNANDNNLTGMGVFMTARAVLPYRSRLKKSRLAILVANEAMYGMARMYQLSIGEFFKGIQAFRNLDEALEFIGLDPSTYNSLKSMPELPREAADDPGHLSE